MNDSTKSLVKILIVLLLSGCMFLVPFDALGVPLNGIQVRVVALFVMAALMWILEPIPIWATSALVIALCLLCASNKSLSALRPDRYEVQAVNGIIDDVCRGVDEEAVAALKAEVKARLDRKPKLDAEEVRMTLGFRLLDTGERAGLRARELAERDEDEAAYDQLALHEGMELAAARLYEPEVAQRIQGLRFVNVMQQKTTMATLADPIIILFLGGFFLAAAATKFRLDQNLARVLLKPFGTDPKFVMLGLMVITAVFSMFMSNTATAAMMLAIVAPVLALFDPQDKGRVAFALCIPVAANIGGIGTPIGTPPNAIALKAIQDAGLDVSFGKWMLFGVPFVMVMLLLSWLLLLKLAPISKKELRLEMGGTFLRTPQAWVVYVTFAVTILLWIFGGNVGLDSNTIAIIPIAVFAVTQVISRKDLNAMSWDVLWLVAGGFALGLALQDTGLAADLINAVPFGEWPFLLLMVGACVICILMSTFMSNTAMAALLMPIMATVGGAMLGAGAISSSSCIGLLVSVALAASLAMALPISTPPNALAYATGMVTTRDMALPGIILGVVGVMVTVGMCFMLGALGFFGE